jgi:DNA modification methylase
MEPNSWPADRVELWPIERLVPYARNARTHTDEQVAQVAASIREWGWTNPVLVAEDGGIIAGHCRVLAGRQLGLAEVPVMLATGWSEAQKRAYGLADNQLALNAGWNPDLLRLELGELQGLEFDLALIGFDDAQLAALTANPGLTDPDEVPEPPAVAIAQRGEVWQLGRHRLVCGDATSAEEVAKALGGVQPHLMVTDPPYGVKYDPDWRNHAVRADGTFIGARAVGKVQNDDRADWLEAWQLFPGCVVYVWHGALHAALVAQSLEQAGFLVRAQIIWEKQHFIIGRGDYHWQHEPCWYAVRKGATGHWAGDRKQSTIWQIHSQIGWESARPDNEDKASGHGTQKPVECMKRPIENNSSPGQAVYDPFVGSGTTIIAAEMTGRACHALEINPTYVDVTIERWQNFTGEKARRQEVA